MDVYYGNIVIYIIIFYIYASYVKYCKKVPSKF